MKTLFAGFCYTLLLIFISTVSKAQWTGTGSNVTTGATEVIINNTKQPSSTFWFGPTNTGPASPGNYYIKAYDYWGPTVHFQATGDNGNERMNVTVDGKMGIGVNSPSSLLHVKGTDKIARFEGTGSGVDVTARIGLYAHNAERANIQWYQVSNSSYLGAVSLNTHGSDGLKPRMFIDPSGNVGIGTENPSQKLELYGSSNTLKIWKGSGYSPIEISSSGDGTNNNAVIGITTYGYGGNQDLNFDITNWGGNFNYSFGASGGSHKAVRITKGGGGSAGYADGYGIIDVFTKNEGMGIRLHGSGNTYFNSGNVGIGTTTPSNKLDVAGTIRGEEVEVEAAPWPDYVFSDSYKLSSLSEVSEFIEENGHLPNIPTAEEVEENGIKLGEMNAKLLEKIEELTLYLIEIKDENNNQKKLNDLLIKRIEKLENNQL